MHRGYSYFNMRRNPNFMKSMPSSSILIFIRILYLFKMPILLKHEWENRKKNLLLFAKSNFELKPNIFLKYCCLCDKIAQTSLLMSFCHFGYYFWCDFYSNIGDVSAFNPTKREREREKEGERDWFYLVTESFALNLVKNM